MINYEKQQLSLTEQRKNDLKDESEYYHEMQSWDDIMTDDRIKYQMRYVHEM